MIGEQADAGHEGGAGSILVVAIVGAVLIAVALVAPLGAMLTVKQRAAGAADAAALAAADVAVGISAGVPCTVAAEVALINGARLTGCTVDGATATVRVEETAGRFAIAATATAGPPP